MMHKNLTLLSLVCLMLLSACGSSSNLGRPYQEGVASWYGPNFDGKQTANGEIFDEDDMTAAHKRLPFNTIVRVVHLKTGNDVVVRINDRGPYADNRIIDLSKEAATELGMIDSGTAPVRLYVLRGPRNLNNYQGDEEFSVQIASYERKDRAERKASSVPNGWVKAYSVNGDRVYRVFSGKFSSKESARQHMYRLRSDGFDGFVKQL